LQVHENNVRPVFAKLLDRFVPAGSLRDKLHIEFIGRESAYALAKHVVIVG
jgi:hypothetical protein